MNTRAARLVVTRSWRITRSWFSRGWLGSRSAPSTGGLMRDLTGRLVLAPRWLAQLQPGKVHVAHVGSLRVTMVLLGLLGAAVGAGLVDGGPSAWLIGGALALLSLQLVVALVQQPVLSRRLPLLIFHLALMMLVLLVGVGRLTALDGRFELTQGVVYEGQLIDGRVGAWHRGALEKLAFQHDGFEVDYAPGRRRGPTRNLVAWVDEHGVAHRAVIGDHHPLVLDGYRIYTSSNKGFAPVLSWLPSGVTAAGAKATPVVALAVAGGAPASSPVQRRVRRTQAAITTGAVHLPSYPMNELRQSREWTLPDGRNVWVKLDFDETLIDPDQAAVFRLPTQHKLVVRLGEQRAELLPGMSVELPGGRLVYEGLRSWMGYRITYDPTLPWLLACALFAVWAMAWHYLRKFADARRPRREAMTEPSAARPPEVSASRAAMAGAQQAAVAPVETELSS
jgi:cytochrome c biogenesis protein